MIDQQAALRGSPSRYALARLQSALTAKGIAWRMGAQSLEWGSAERILFGGPQDERLLARLREASVSPPTAPESLCIKVAPGEGGPQLLMYGSDERGLAYALYEVARAIELLGSEQDPFAGVQDAAETPELIIRSCIRTMMNRELDVVWLHSTDFWAAYLDTLVATRHNRLKLSIGWRSVYFSPPYPFLLEVPGYEDVIVTNVSPQERAQNLRVLQTISAMAKDRGLEFYLDTYWMSHRPMGDWAEARQYVILGLTDETLPDYTRRGIEQLLRACPCIDGIGMSGSMHENGVAQEFMYAFFDGIAACGRPVGVQIELKGVHQELVDQATARGIHVTLGGKYCMEHKGLPYHPTQIRLEELEALGARRWTRNSYADMLYHPRTHNFMFNLWNWGTHKVLIWGDPQDVARMARNSRISGSLGMEHGDPLTYKGSYSSGPRGDWRIVQDQSLEYYEWEYERYWYHYLLYGRLMYNSHTSPQVWQREFAQRFGQAAAPMLRALAAASKTSPLMTMVHAPSASDNYYWPEVYTNVPIVMPDPNRRDGGERFELCNPADTALFYRVDQFVADYLADRLAARYDPLTVQGWFARYGSQALREMAAAEQVVADPTSAEFRATRIDVLAQAHLALFFGHKLEAATQFGFFRECGDVSALGRAIAAYEKALTHWQEIVATVGDAYPANLAFHRNEIMSGHWRDRIAAIREDLEQMRMLRERFLAQYRQSSVSFGHVPSWVQHLPLVRIESTIKGWGRLAKVLLHYRIDGDEAYRSAPMSPDPACQAVYSAQCAAPERSTTLSYYMEARLNTGETVLYPRGGPAAPIVIGLGQETPAPACRHLAPTTFERGKPLTLELAIDHAATLRSVTLYYRHVNQAERMREMQMQQGHGCYRATIPADYSDSRYDLMCYFGVVDRMGHRVIYPGLEGDADAPYIVVPQV